MCTTDRMGEKGPPTSKSQKETHRPRPRVYDPTLLSDHANVLHSHPTQLHYKNPWPSENSTKPNAIHDNPLFHLLCNLLVNRITEILDRAFTPPQYDRL
jgi:hypothetical protein